MSPAAITESSAEDARNTEKLDFSSSVILILCTNVIYLTGIPGNILTLVVLQKKNMKDNFVSVFMSAVCLIDLWCLLTGFPAYWWMGITQGEDVRFISRTSCLYHWLITLLGLQLTQWMIIIITVSRTYRITRKHVTPLMRPDRLPGCGNALLITAALLAVVLIPGYFIIDGALIVYYRGEKLRTCEYRFVTLPQLIYFATALLLPPIILIIANVVMQTVYGRSTPHTMRLRPTNIAARKRMRLMIMMADMMYFITSIPPLVYHEVSIAYSIKPNGEVSHLRDTENFIMYCLLYSGFSFNMFFYCSFGRRFRGELKLMLYKPLYRMGILKKLDTRQFLRYRSEEPAPFSIFTQSSSTNTTTKNSREHGEGSESSTQPQAAKIPETSQTSVPGENESTL